MNLPDAAPADAGIDAPASAADGPAAATDARDVVDGPTAPDAALLDAAVPDARFGPVTLTVIDKGIVVANVSVSFATADGILLFEATSDAEGHVVASVSDNVTATAIFGATGSTPLLRSVTGINVGDAITLFGEEPDFASDPVVGSAKVVFPGSVDGAASDFGRPLMYSRVDLAYDSGDVTITMPDWLALTATVFSFTDVPDGVKEVGLSARYGDALADDLSQPVTLAAVPPMPFVIRAQTTFGGSSGCGESHADFALAEQPDMYTLNVSSTLLPAIQLVDTTGLSGAKPVLAWSPTESLSGADGGEATVVYDADGRTITWSVELAPADRVVFPQLPPAFENLLPQTTSFGTTVRFVDIGVWSSYEAFKAGYWQRPTTGNNRSTAGGNGCG